MIPAFHQDGYLPEGVHRATEAELIFRLRSATRRRRRLALCVSRWIELARAVRARRLLIDGSFVTAKPDPHDVDAVLLLTVGFSAHVHTGDEAALKLEQMLLTLQPGELFAAEDDADWNVSISFGGRTRETDDGHKALVEIELRSRPPPDTRKPRTSCPILNPVFGRRSLRIPAAIQFFTMAGLRKMIARQHEELSTYKGSEEVN